MAGTPIHVRGDVTIDRLQSFQVRNLDVRGRMVRLGPVLDEILAAHAYPAAASRLLAEAVTLTALIGSVLREDGGQITLQATAQDRETSAVRMLVCDFVAGDVEKGKPAALRGYLDHDPERLSRVAPDAPLQQLMPDGRLMLTIDLPSSKDRFQSIIALANSTLAQTARDYFQGSEQLPSWLQLEVRHDGLTDNWFSGGMLVQHLPQAEEGSERLFALDEDHPNWAHARILAETVRPEELTDPALGFEELLWRLFNQDEARVYPPAALAKGCRCSMEHIKSVLRQFSFEELADMREPDGSIRVNCAFCSKDWVLEKPRPVSL